MPLNVPADGGESTVEGAHFVGTVARSDITLDAEVLRGGTGGGTEIARRWGLRRPALGRNYCDQRQQTKEKDTAAFGLLHGVHASESRQPTHPG